jgi:hypothetical protein
MQQIRPRLATGAPTASPIMRSGFRILVWLFCLATLVVPGAAAVQAQLPILHLNQAYVEEATRPCSLDVKDPKAVFAFVFNSLPDRVKVYPTENYFYYTFICNGAPFDGNIRLDASNRDDGKVIFAYSEDLEGWRGETLENHVILDASAGVQLEKLQPLLYRMTYQGKSVEFALNDLSDVKPPPNALAPDEEYIGPSFDESAIRFFLVFDKTFKIFHFILDETIKVADQFEPSPHADRILIGKRTGFAFYRDHLRDRKIMIGAYKPNMLTNTWFDGPFDQLGDNFIQGETLRDALIAQDSGLKGRIDRFGGFPGGEERMGIDPYLPYSSVSELTIFDRCATARQKSPTYYLCFAVDYDREGRPFIGAYGPQRSRGGRR